MNSNRIRMAGKVAVALALILVSAVGFAAEKKAPGDMVAVVNGTIITQGEFDRVMDYELRRAAQSGQQIPDAQMPKIENSILDSLIVGELLFQESKKKGIQVKPETVAEQLTIVKKRFPSEAEFKKALEENKMTESKIKADIKRDMAIQQLLDKEVDQKVQISDEEGKTFYDTNPQLFQQPERVKASHILIKVDQGATEEKKVEARKKIKEVQEKVKKGEDFAELAKTYSEGPSAPRGGDLGLFGRGQMVKPFEDAAFSLKPNETSDIVETKFGYHLIKVVDKQPAKKIAYADVKDRINKHLKDQKLRTDRQLYFDKLKKDAKIEKFL
ncbi:MAG: peptidylprolyl isomerase [Desulfobacterales bacterium]|jgi:peptidyl-prolyl cis-trans isomerase C